MNFFITSGKPETSRGKEGDVAFDPDVKVVYERSGTGWNNGSPLAAPLGYTPEDVANKSTNVTTDGTSDTKYPSVKSVKTYVDDNAGIQPLDPLPSAPTDIDGIIQLLADSGLCDQPL